MFIGLRTALGGAVAVLVVANLLNNWFAPTAYVATAVIACVLLLGLLRLAKGTWADAGLGQDTLRRGVAWGLALSVGAAVVVLACVLAPPTRHLFLDPRVEGAGPEAIAFAALVRVPVGTVLLEEIGFRGVVYGLAARIRGFTWATGISSGLFGLWHLLPAISVVADHPAASGAGSPIGAAVAVAMLATSLVGVGLCELRRRSGSLIPCIALHWTVNALAYVAAYLVFQTST